MEPTKQTYNKIRIAD